MMRGLLLIIGALACFVGGVQSAAAQTNEYHWVNVCNRGDVDLNYVVLRTRWNLGQGDRAQLSGWHTIRPGKCEDVNLSIYQGVAVGFTHALMNGGLGNPVYLPEDAQAANGNKRAPAVLCVPQSGAINRKGSLTSVLSGAMPALCKRDISLENVVLFKTWRICACPQIHYHATFFSTARALAGRIATRYACSTQAAKTANAEAGYGSRTQGGSCQDAARFLYGVV